MTRIRIFILSILAMALAGCAATGRAQESTVSSLVLVDSARERSIPVELYFPEERADCTAARRCSVAIISPGYRIGHTDYSFIADALTELGYLAVSVQHELASDPPLATGGNLFSARTPDWQRGAENLRYVRESLRVRHPHFDWDHVTLIGHSNGGDISAWLARESPDFAEALITLDHRRVPLPRAAVPRVLSIRAGDFPADEGVLPTPDEQSAHDACIERMQAARHNDMHDGGPVGLKQSMARSISRFLTSGACGSDA